MASDYCLRSLVESALPWIAALSPVPRLGSRWFLAAGFVVGDGGVHNGNSRAQLHSGQLFDPSHSRITSSSANLMKMCTACRSPTTWPLDDKAFVPAKDKTHSSRLAKHPSCSFTSKYPSQPLGQDWRRGEADQPTQNRCISTPPSLARRPCPSPCSVSIPPWSNTSASRIMLAFLPLWCDPWRRLLTPCETLSQATIATWKG